MQEIAPSEEDKLVAIQEAAWIANCSTLVGCSTSDAIVSEMLQVYGDYIKDSVIDFPEEGDDYTARFELSASHLTPQQIATLCDTVETTLPILAYARSTIWGLQHPTELPPQLQCIPVDFPSERFDTFGAKNIGRLACVKGTIVSISVPRLVCTRMPFLCTKCKKVRTLDVDGKLVYPAGCEGRCRGYSFVPQAENAASVEVQILRLQEEQLIDEPGSDRSGGSASRMIEVLLKAPLIDTAGAGEVVTVCGILGTRRGERKFSGTYQLTIKALSVVAHGARHKGADKAGERESSVSPEEASWFRARASEGQAWFELLQRSLCPSIFGHDMVKQALVIALLGGSKKSSMRSNIHCVVVGDPGMGKSQLLRAASHLSPRSAYVSANTSSTCGLTLTLSKDPVTGEATFEAGAVVHGDGGTTCIDEIDKGASEHKALLEVMEQEALSMAKAGMVFTMPIHTTILAAGNPVGGRFSFDRSIADNINMSPALLSRFDFVWLLKDAPNSAQERDITAHVLNQHRRGAGNAATFSTQERRSNEILPPKQFMDFIKYARDVCAPVLSQDASNVLLEAYLMHRKDQRFASVTPRHLQSMIRIAEARAKAELRNEVTELDAQYAVDILRKCNESALQSTNGRLGDLPTGKKAPKKNLKDQVMDTIKGRLVARNTNTISEVELLEICSDHGAKNPDRTIQQLSDFGYILQQSAGTYRVKRTLGS